MGLSIFIYKTRRNSNDVMKVNFDDDLEFRKRFSKRMEKYYIPNLTSLSEKGDTSNFNAMYGKMVRFLNKNTNSTWIVREFVKKVTDIQSILRWYSDNKWMFILKYNYYYHKLYFLQQFFTEIEKMEELDGAVKNEDGDIMASWIEKKTFKSLLSEIDKVVSEKYSMEYFMYYDEIEDIVKLRRDLRRIIKNWKEDEKYYIIFSY